ncbi:DEAD/DEAH box helicase family protein [Bacillus sp. V3B]|uniref:DEAD/DEAH box helicase family protein n=1 Tax=Bacillus sp. V3B TaxID=2804915 RepID=UPI00210EF79B|nr:DEAD/DEAH box helicase family protein [Bacillus sp. V3B]MCQ6277083.1 DEAD/DEAH box helicase family protein [Bacillus sp. V3B]
MTKEKVQLITERLIDHLITEIDRAKSIYILTSFAMKSGVNVISSVLKRAAERGVDIKICTGDYLFVTQPEALMALIDIYPTIEVRLWQSNGVSFHPKAYIFQYDDSGTLIVGSSNLSRSALTSGIEWNLSLDKEVGPEAYDHAVKTYIEDIFYSDQTVPVNDETIKNYRDRYEKYHQKHDNLVTTWTELEEIELMLPADHKAEAEVVMETPETYGEIKPRFAQPEALEQLETTLEEGYHSALVVMATGLGKTYLAGFFAEKFKRTLFIAHREEILHQAKRSFGQIMPDRNSGIYNGKVKDAEADSIFASISTLSMKHHLEVFQPDTFDLIIIDEFHHAAATTYQRVLDYFKPQFLLGITATPDRNDNKDVYAICNGNVAYRIDFLEAIQRQWLAPFKYVGVYDDTDYSQLTWLGTRYAEEDLLKVQLREEMAESILQAWKEHKQTRTIVFCSSIRQAVFLSSYFNQQGFKTVSLHSKQMDISRSKAINLLEKGELDAIFTVDLFNEGVDIPAVDTLLFVRPTESLTVFTQQVGRGLRLYPEKESCVIIDLIGNYRNADIKLSVFDTNHEAKKKNAIIEPTVPQLCSFDLDIRAINLLKEMTRKKHPRRQKLYDDYFALKQELGRRPSYLELHLKGGSEASVYKQEFQSYVGFLLWAGELSGREQEVFRRYEAWIVEVEKTVMSKSYKMVVLKVMLDRGVDQWFQPITPSEAASTFHHYLTGKEYRKRIDLSDKAGKQLWEYHEDKVSKLIARMPMSKWSGSSKGLITFENSVFQLHFDIVEEDREILYQWTKEICEYRLHQYFERRDKREN